MGAGRALWRCSEQCRGFLWLLLVVSISACSAIRLVTSGLNHTKEGRRQRSFTCGLSSSISDHLPDALIEDAVEASDSLSGG